MRAAAVRADVLDAADLHARHDDRVDHLALRARALPADAEAVEALLARGARLLHRGIRRPRPARRHAAVLRQLLRHGDPRALALPFPLPVALALGLLARDAALLGLGRLRGLRPLRPLLRFRRRLV